MWFLQTVVVRGVLVLESHSGAAGRAEQLGGNATGLKAGTVSGESASVRPLSPLGLPWWEGRPTHGREETTVLQSLPSSEAAWGTIN